MVKEKAVIFLLISLSLCSAITITSAGEPPLADAGLDQTVTRGTTVLLDGTGSYAPDGTIENYRWEITGPNGTTVPKCPTCAQTQFQPAELGKYDVTLTVTDSNGVSSSDTLYVRVRPDDGPTISITGSQNPTVGETSTYQATIQSDAAELETVTWTVAGSEIEQRDLSGYEDQDTLDFRFAETGPHNVNVTVHDAYGQQRTEPYPVVATSGATIKGPSLVTGSRPLRGTYSIQTKRPRSEISEVSWHGLNQQGRQSMEESTTWEPGTHELYAEITYTDGVKETAAFPDGTKRVIADPKPAVSIRELTAANSISGTATATDRYGNLQRLSIRVNDNLVSTETARVKDETQLTVPFTYENISYNETNRITVTAVDSRGQQTKTTREIEANAPEIIRSEFTNDPVDSYHEKLNSSRYTAKHVLEIELNGSSPDEVQVKQYTNSPLVHRIDGEEKVSSSKRVDDGILFVESHWASEIPGQYSINAKIVKSGHDVGKTKSTFEVTSSKPELRYEVVSDGTVRQKTDWGIVVDASESFDPDGTNLKYIWKEGATAASEDGSIGKFSSLELANLAIRDELGLTTENKFNFLGLYNPGIYDVIEASEGPYKPNESVRLAVVTDNYRLTKNRYSISLGFDTNGFTTHASNWRKIDVKNGQCIQEKESCHHPGLSKGERIDTENRQYSYYYGDLSVEASEFSNRFASQSVETFNEEHPERTRKQHDLPNLNVLLKGSKVWRNVSVEHLEYDVERPKRTYVTTQSEETRDQLSAEGYVVGSVQTGTEYVLEKYTKVQDAEYETKTKTFHHLGSRDFFLILNPDWEEAGSETKTVTETKLETEWRNEKGGDGTFTGETRRIVSEPAEYRTKKEYKYDYEVTKTGTREVTRTRTIPVTKTDTRKTITCDGLFSCSITTETYRYRTTETRTYTTTETYTYTTTRTSSYWSFNKRSAYHTPTGRTTRIKLSPAQYKTQYKFETEVEETKTVEQYFAEREVQVQEEKYGWEVADTTKDAQYAKSTTRMSDDWRIKETTTTSKWRMVKDHGIQTKTVSRYWDSDNVIETRATITGNVVQRYINTKTGEKEYERIDNLQKEVTDEKAVTKDELLDRYSESKSEDSTDQVDWCLLKGYC